MHPKFFLKNILFLYVSLSIAAIVSLQIIHLKFVHSSVIEEADRTLNQNATTASSLVCQTQQSGEILAGLEMLTNQYDSKLFIEIIDSNGELFFRSPNLDPHVSFVKIHDPASSEIHVVDIGGRQVFRILTKKVDGFTLFAAYPEPTLEEIAAKDFSDNRYLFMLFFLLAAFTGFFVYGFFVRPLRALNRHLKELLPKSSSSEAVQAAAPSKCEQDGSIETTSKMVEQLNTARNQALNFSSFASHELRTPLTIIQSQLEDALSADIPHQTLQKLIGEVYDDMLRLNNTVEGLLNLSTMQAGTFALNLETIPVQRFFKDFYDEALFLTRPKNITVVLGKGPELYLSADTNRLRQVFFNLLDNAVKNTPENHRIHLGYEQQGEHVLIRFADSGNGISPEILPRIFEPFMRGNDTAGDNRGAGLGLALVKLIVELHGGSISAESVIGIGTTFFLRFPLAPLVERAATPVLPFSSVDRM